MRRIARKELDGVKKNKRLSERKIKELWKHSSSCYEAACQELGFNNFSIREMFRDELITKEEAEFKFNQIDELYRSKLCKLPSDVIEGIICSNDLGLQRRSRKTIENLMSELLERQLNNEKD